MALSKLQYLLSFAFKQEGASANNRVSPHAPGLQGKTLQPEGQCLESLEPMLSTKRLPPNYMAQRSGLSSTTTNRGRMYTGALWSLSEFHRTGRGSIQVLWPTGHRFQDTWYTQLIQKLLYIRPLSQEWETELSCLILVNKHRESNRMKSAFASWHLLSFLNVTWFPLSAHLHPEKNQVFIHNHSPPLSRIQVLLSIQKGKLI